MSNESNFRRYKEKSANLWHLSDFGRGEEKSTSIWPNESAQSNSGCDDCDDERGTISGCVLRPSFSDAQKIAILKTIEMFLNPTDLNPTDM